MRFIVALGFVIVTCGLLLSQKNAAPGLSKHANASGKHGGSGGVAASANTKANADALAKIEQQRMTGQRQSATPRAAAPPTRKTTQQSKNRPIKFAHHAPPSK